MAPQPERQAVPVADTSNSFKSKTTLSAGGKTYAYFWLPAAEKAGLAGISRLPISLKVLLENLLRNEDGRIGQPPTTSAPSPPGSTTRARSSTRSPSARRAC